MKALFIIASFLSSTFFHDVAVAVFTVYESEGTLQLKVVIDRADLCKELSIGESDLNVKSVQDYLDTYCHFIINESQVSILVDQINNDEDHLVVEAILEKAPKNYQTISVSNSCLLSISNHSNIVRFKLNDTQRDFRMHKGRTTIELTY